MSIRFYYTPDDSTVLTSLTVKSINKYAQKNGIKYADTEDSRVFTMTWKKFNDMIKDNIPKSKRHIRPQFVRLVDSPTYVVRIMLPIRNRPIILTSSSNKTAITPEITQIADEIPITIIFDKIGNNNINDDDSESSSDDDDENLTVVRKVNIPQQYNTATSNIPVIDASDNVIEGFSRSCEKVSTFEYVLFIIGLLIIIYLIYSIFIRKPGTTIVTQTY
ncbi:putative ORFan [Tupanvirus deep ocean]|uniref:ORFan n=2 Tax=Tupanvirus TaxID=2094720 RepID=A0AC62A979_9VIRU|nr:putative ORFan [Tupanvirus deep ocean]QKU34322.1 putative ORFan [Tupanvirus deep ocean]